MTRITYLFISIVVLCGFRCAAQNQAPVDTLQCVTDSLSDTIKCVPREPMTPGDSLRYVVDSWLNKDNSKYKSSKQSYTVGCCIYDLTADSMLYTLNPDKLMIPASTQKLYIATAMLEKRGMKYTFDTRAYTDGKYAMDSIGRKYLDGNVYITTSCDPTIDKHSPDKIVRDILSLGLDSISGQFIQCATPQAQKLKLPEDIFASYIVQKLNKDGMAIQYHKASETSVIPNGKMRGLSHLSTPIEDVLDRMLRRSDNNYAECMLLNLCDNDSNWTYSGCKDVVCKMVDRIYRRYNHDECDISDSYYIIKDGSGLSHSNKTSARSQVDLLRYIYGNKKIFNPIYGHLPIAGVSGTLSKRMTSGRAYDNVHAKTGTVDQTKTLSGYVTTASNHMIAFSILFNKISDKSVAKKLQDQVCEFLAGLEI